jgi:single-stranded-DNA-specific exonuclease
MRDEGPIGNGRILSSNENDALGPLRSDLSVSKQQWRYRLSDKASKADLLSLTQLLEEKYGYSSSIAQALSYCLLGREIGPSQLDDFLRPSLKNLFPDPFSFLDMGKAVDVIISALIAKKNILVFADYDVDGATSGALLMRWFEAMGHPISPYVPDRLTEGYGPSTIGFDRIHSMGIDLVITVDCGAMAHEAIEYANQLGLDIVVIDHHLMRSDPPKAQAVVNPNRPGCQSQQGNLAAAGVVYVALAALNREAQKRGLFEGRSKPNLLEWLDLAALGAICDVTRLTGFNRALAYQGLKVMSARKNKGINALLTVAGGLSQGAEALKSFHSGFVLGPRINAGGRVGRSDLGIRLLSTQDDAEAIALSYELDQLNILRREVEDEILQQAFQKTDSILLKAPEEPILIIDGEDWHPGVIGIVASRIKDRYLKPVIVIGWDPMTGLGKGSGRSLEGVNLGQAIQACFDHGHLLSGGGHAMAAGLSLKRENFAPFDSFLKSLITQQNRGLDVRPILEIDASLTLKRLDRGFYDILSDLAPFGPGNPEAVWLLQKVRINHALLLKGGHARLDITDSSHAKAKAMAWRIEGRPLKELLFQQGVLVDLVVQLKPDDFQGRNTVQLEILDAMPSL